MRKKDLGDQKERGGGRQYRFRGSKRALPETNIFVRVEVSKF